MIHLNFCFLCSTKAKSELPSLRCLNSETVRTLSGVSLLVHKATSFEITCLQQTLLHKDLKQTRDRDSRYSHFVTTSGNGDVYTIVGDKYIGMYQYS